VSADRSPDDTADRAADSHTTRAPENGTGGNGNSGNGARAGRKPARKADKSERKSDHKPERKPDRAAERKPERKPDRKIERRSDRVESKPLESRRSSTGRRVGLDTPLDSRRSRRGPAVDGETFGRWSERFARFMGTASFLVGMTVFVGAWLAWNWLAPTDLQFDPRRLNFTLMTLILSLQASYAAPLILLAQNRQADRDRVSAEQDRDRAERALADTEYLAREVAALRIALGEVATRDFVRSELRDLFQEFQEFQEVTRSSREKDDSFGSTPDAELPTDRG
jgi:uncharacterized membrane protein